MPHLIGTFRSISLARCREQLAASHQALTACAQKALNQALDLGEQGWGGRMKRLNVFIDPDEAQRVGLRQGNHNFV